MAEGSTTLSDLEAEHSEMEPTALQPKRRRCLLLCGHCDRYLSKSTYYRHREAYFNHASGQWQRSRLNVSCLSDDPSSATEQGDYVYREGQGEDNGVESQNYSDSESNSADDGGTNSSCILDDLRELELEEIWMSSSDEDGNSRTEEDNNSESPLSRPVWQLMYFLLMWQTLYRVSNAALKVLLKFLSLFVLLFGRAFAPAAEYESLHKFATEIPHTIQNGHKLLWNTKGDEFITYVVCPKCDSLYEYDDCIVTIGGKKESKKCEHIAYPNHPHIRRRQKCDTLLLKKVRSGRSYKLSPIKAYPYLPLHKSLTYLAKQEGFLDACEQWRNRSFSIPRGYLGDIYDGRVWHEFQTEPTLKYFLQTPQCYLLTLNVDWFQPFTHTQYSVGAIYLTVQNLPRSERYKEENVILVGIIPGPSEPSLTINSYLAPLVQELEHAWNSGLRVKTPSNSVVTIRLALSCVTCDIPASRKVCGFLGHNAFLGCNKCYKEFPSSTEDATDDSGYDRHLWTLRNCELHRQHCEETLCETTKTGMRKKESEFGVRYSVLLSLPYFDPVRYTAVDIMHNLFLGTGKHVFKLWIKLGILDSHKLDDIDNKARKLQVPNSLGRLPINITSNYGGFKAAQWQTWITVYSPVILKGIIPDDHLQCWLLYVRACTILSQRILRESDIVTADLLLLTFCKKFEELYGGENCTPNLHLHLHLKDCLLDYGPSHAFWCFSFERYNGLLGSFHTNKRSIEQQIMRKFVNAQHLRSETNLADAQIISLLPSSQQPAKPTLTTVSTNDTDILQILRLSSSPLPSVQSFENRGIAALLPPLREDVFDSTIVEDLKLLYTQLYPNQVVARVSPFYIRSGRATLCNQVIGSTMNATSSNSSSVIMAYWPARGNDLSFIDYSRMRIGIVHYYCKHQVVFTVSSDTIAPSEHLFAYVSWKQRHPHEEWYGISATVALNIDEPSSPCNFIPIQRIHSLCAHGNLDTNIHGHEENVYVAIPVPLKFTM